MCCQKREHILFIQMGREAELGRSEIGREEGMGNGEGRKALGG